jgi:hypothetical protein
VKLEEQDQQWREGLPIAHDGDVDPRGEVDVHVGPLSFANGTVIHAPKRDVQSLRKG